jgi:lactose/L-arabinose transport system ATP-binding protein
LRVKPKAGAFLINQKYKPWIRQRSDLMSKVSLNNVIKKYGDVQVIHGIDLEINDGEFCVFVGPSGCGKSTLLRMVAGLEETTGGQINIGERDVTTADPSERGVAMVFQTYALYPHMTVRDNMGFGLKMNKHPKAEIVAKVAEASRILKLDEYLERKPAALSGGQRQRVSIGRAIVRGPEVFLFDEPLSNLDAELRVEMRVEIARLHKEIGATMIYVTHDQVEAMTLADKIVVLRLGVIEQAGSPMELYRDPDNKFVAGFIGSPAMNFMDGVLGEGGVVTVPALQRDVSAGVGGVAGSKVSFGVRPEHITLDPAGSTHKVDMTESLGGVSYAYIVSETGERLIVEERGDVRSSEGDVVGLSFEESRSYVFDAASELRIR